MEHDRDDLTPEALRRDTDVFTFRASGPGGQHRNTTESAVRLVHVPTGLTVIAAEHRQQGRNRELAFERLRDRLVARRRKPKRRVATKPSRGAVERRLETKRKRSQKKNQRRRTTD